MHYFNDFFCVDTRQKYSQTRKEKQSRKKEKLKTKLLVEEE
jgi:hypothetical protein